MTMKARILTAALYGVSLLNLPMPTLAQNYVPTPLPGCVEGRVVRQIGGVFACAAGKPVVSSCGTGASISTNATDYGGQIVMGTGIVTSCALALSKLYTSPAMGCIAQTNSGTAIALSPVVTASTTTVLTIPLVASLPGGIITYTCFPV